MHSDSPISLLNALTTSPAQISSVHRVHRGNCQRSGGLRSPGYNSDTRGRNESTSRRSCSIRSRRIRIRNGAAQTPPREREDSKSVLQFFPSLRLPNPGTARVDWAESQASPFCSMQIGIFSHRLKNVIIVFIWVSMYLCPYLSSSRRLRNLRTSSRPYSSQ